MAEAHTHAAPAHAASGLKRKVGPLPLWSWIVIVGGTIGIYLLYRSSSSSTGAAANSNTVDPSSPTGLTYGQEAQDAALGIDPATGETYAQEQAASAGGGGGTSGAGGTSAPDDSAALSQIDSDLNNGFTSISGQISNEPVQDPQTPAQTFGGEVSDVVGGISALKSAGLIDSPAPATQAKPKAPSLAAGALRAPFGATKPAAKAGYTIVGQGNGYWEYVPVAKTTVSHTSAPKPTAPPKPEPKSSTVSGKKAAKPKGP